MCTGLPERTHGLLDHGEDALLDGEDAEVPAVGHPHPIDRAAGGGDVVYALIREAEGVARVGSYHRAEHEGGVLDRTAQGTAGGERRVGEEGVRAGGGGDPSEGGLEPVDAAEGGGDADRATGVGALGYGAEAVRDGRGAPARGAASVLAWGERRARRAEEEVVGRALVAELRRVGLAEDDRARLLQALDVGGVVVRHVAGQRFRAEGVPDAGLVVEEVFYRHRNPVQGARWSP